MIKKPEGIIPPVCVLSVVIQLSISTPSAAHTTPPRSAARPERNADDPGQNNVQREQGDPTAQGAAAWYDPEAQPPDAERQPAEYP